MLRSHYCFSKILCKSLSSALLNLHTISKMVYTTSNLKKFLLNTDLRTASSLARVTTAKNSSVVCVIQHTQSWEHCRQSSRKDYNRYMNNDSKRYKFYCVPWRLFFYYSVKYSRYLSIFPHFLCIHMSHILQLQQNVCL